MANWDKILSRGNVEDRRSMAPAIGGISLTGVAIVLLLNFLSGGDVGDVLTQLETVPVENTQNLNKTDFEGLDSYEDFTSKVLGSNNEMWNVKFTENGQTYSPPKLVLFRSATASGCGTATSEVGPHYCSLDKTIYLDETFFDVLENRFGATGGDVAEAYVISHEVGHHVQNELGIMENVGVEMRKDKRSGNELSVNLELQADCFAGLWANSIKDLEIFLPGEIGEAMDAAAAVGDDRIQQEVTGQVNPENWTHGSSAQRVEWFGRGFETGAVDSCNTFGR